VSKPTAEELQKVFKALVDNGFDFFLRSAEELEHSQKFSVVHFATGVELLLKARLFHEHWTLIAAKPHECSWEDLKNGKAITISASQICSAIEKAACTDLSAQKQLFKAIFDHRNRVIHFAPQEDIAKTVAEQCLAWHHLRRLLTQTWRLIFGEALTALARIEDKMRKNRGYLEVRLEQAKPELAGPSEAGRLSTCPACELDAAVASVTKGRVVNVDCVVCDYRGVAMRSARLTRHLDGSETSEILDELDPTGEPDRAHCGTCCDNEPCVCMDGDDYVCVLCAERFEAVSVCECCNTRWAGWDNESSYYTGCDECDGFDYDKD
jgi:hypothetical protein